MKLDPFFTLLLAAIVTWSVYHFYYIKDRVADRQRRFEAYPKTFDVVFSSTVIAAACLLIQSVGRRVLQPVAERMLPHNRWSRQVFALKQRRFSEMAFKAVYFLAIAFFAFYYLHNETWWPRLLGGKGNEDALFNDYPNQESHPFTHIYFYISAGYHLACFVSLLLSPKLPDFFETLLPCVCAMLLIFFSYLGNFLRVGSIILFCHDFCDIFSCGCKVFVDTRHKAVTFSLFACLVGAWGYLRLFAFPAAALFPIFTNVKNMKATAEGEDWGFFVFLLLTLFVMNIYWFGLMLKMCLHFFTSGQMSDLHSPEVAEEPAEPERRKSARLASNSAKKSDKKSL
ncbi:longevity-assurance protein (LAG1) domain-containing protein [Besnoitia besnoiti]|uniref:Longevity-assurance protein (LAG1) domain-containing protein n=1 Tax=Besnoitia besnoiti TaxID=94643 RepID=A0A2A9MAR3_BESBE|nr:longevity-assurance protein (LAG1) domain-containing protein [Besnoitia besnoiti]PFH33391.1 longevity-assurance protein (LAG1) domain-containing protein [Besnoitia besnoiti]